MTKELYSFSGVQLRSLSHPPFLGRVIVARSELARPIFRKGG